MTVEELLNVLILMDLNRAVIFILDLHIKKFPCNLQVLHLKSFTESALDCEDVFLILTGNYQIIDI